MVAAVVAVVVGVVVAVVVAVGVVVVVGVAVVVVVIFYFFKGEGMTIDELTIGEAKCPFVVGKAYFIRTCTYHLTGRVCAIVGNFLILNDAAFVADSGRFAPALSRGELREVEPMPDGTIVSMGAITDAAPWNHDLPREQK